VMRILAIVDRLRGKILQSKFLSWGMNSSIGVPLRVVGQDSITVGDNTVFNDGLILTSWTNYGYGARIVIGSNVTIGAFNHITCVNKVVIGDGFLSGKWVTITDNSHGSSTIDDLIIPPSQRQVVSKGPVLIGKNVWIGDKSTILPGVIIGDGVIIGANSVVTKSIPPFCVAAGNPAVIIKKISQ